MLRIGPGYHRTGRPAVHSCSEVVYTATILNRGRVMTMPSVEAVIPPPQQAIVRLSRSLAIGMNAIALLGVESMAGPVVIILLGVLQLRVCDAYEQERLAESGGSLQVSPILVMLIRA